MFLIELFKHVGNELSGNMGGIVVPLAAEGVDLNFIFYKFTVMVFIFSVLSLLSVLNIKLYFLIIIYSDNIKFLQDWSKKSPLFAKFLKSYKKTRLSLIVIEFIIFILCTGGMI